MRSLLLLLVVLCIPCVCLCVETSPLCPSLPVELQLRHNNQDLNRYKLVFAAIDPHHSPYNTEFVDIHFRVNNEDSKNVRVLTQSAVTQENLPAKQAQVENIVLMPGDVLRAYATYSAKGYACDTPMHTFNAPDWSDSTTYDNIDAFQLDPRFIKQQHKLRQQQKIIDQQNRFVASAYYGIDDSDDVDTLYSRRYAVDPRQSFSASAVRQMYMPTRGDDQDLFMINDEQTKTGSVCPSIPIDEDILKIKGLQDTYLLQFENKNPIKQLHYVDLHISTDPENQLWDNLRLGTDMQLNLAHKVMQPGIVVRPYEKLHWYWSYRTTDANNQVIDCTTPINSISPIEVTHEINMKQFQKLVQ